MAAIACRTIVTSRCAVTSSSSLSSACRQGDEKPHVENRVKTTQRRFGTPVPRVKDFDELNARLLDFAIKEQSRPSPREGLTIGEAFAIERTHARPLPTHPFDACIRRPVEGGQVSDGGIRQQPLQRAEVVRLPDGEREGIH